MAALHDVQRYAIKMDAQATRHVRTLAGIFEPGPFNPLFTFSRPTWLFFLTCRFQVIGSNNSNEIVEI